MTLSTGCCRARCCRSRKSCSGSRLRRSGCMKFAKRAAAETMPGVTGVVTGHDLVSAGVKPLPNSADFKRPDGKPLASPPRHALAVDTVRFVGEAVAVVLAQTRVQAQDAMEAIDIRYDVLPAVTNLNQAMTGASPHVWDKAPDNI